MRREDPRFKRLLSVRGRNLRFLSKVAGALQLDRLDGEPSREKYRAAFTAGAVRRIHEAVVDIWPPDTDIASVLRRARGPVSGLYVGDHHIDRVLRAVVRHSTYAGRILVVDPFLYPPKLQDEYNPILNPAQYRPHTLKSVNFYLHLLPWIEAGIVNIIRTPADFDLRLLWDSAHRRERALREHPSLREALKQSEDEDMERFKESDGFRDLVLSAPDDYLQRMVERGVLDGTGVTPAEYMAHIEEMRASDPDFLAPAEWGESRLTVTSVGANYEVAKLTAEMTGSYLLTDLRLRWKEIELDREDHSVESRAWAPFAKAVQNAPFRYLDQVALPAALKLRQEGRLESFRSFFHKVWRQQAKGDEYDEANAVCLALELQEKLREAEEEWKRIDRDLLTTFGQGVAAGTVAGVAAVASGHAAFLPAAAVAAAAGAKGLVQSVAQRRGFEDRFPAALFMDLSERRH